VTDGPFAPIIRVAAALEQLGVRYMICGSVASSMHGEPRTTHDADLVADLSSADVAALARLLQDHFDADPRAMAAAVRDGSMFNVLDKQTGLKIDVILLRRRPFSRSELERAVATALPGGAVVKIATAEDVLLAKLEWFRKGGEVSERQWRDVLGILKAQQQTLDLAYVRRWAGELGVVDLLDRALLQTLTRG
jgi:hypothetical protein